MQNSELGAHFSHFHHRCVLSELLIQFLVNCLKHFVIALIVSSDIINHVWLKYPMLL